MMARKNSSKTAATTKANQKNTKTATNANGKKNNAEEEEPFDLTNFVRNSALICIFVVLPYALYNGYIWVRLQSGFERNVVTIKDQRQALILGTQCSGTSATAKHLNDLGIEMGHETTDALFNFARDGTIGWAQGIYFFGRNGGEPNIDLLCEKPRARLRHSTQFQPSDQCSYRVMWDKCWQNTCKDVFQKNYGCFRRNDCQS